MKLEDLRLQVRQAREEAKQAFERWWYSENCSTDDASFSEYHKLWTKYKFIDQQLLMAEAKKEQP